MSGDAVILANLGSPLSPSPKDVGRFLRRFLSDRRVVEASPLIWKPLLYGLIVPLRKKRSAKAYQEIWWPDGSPIRVISERQGRALADELHKELGENAPAVYVAECYGEKNIETVLREITEKHQGRILVLPMYPQYSATTTAAVMDQCARFIQSQRRLPELSLISHYYQRAEYIEALAASVRECWAGQGETERLLISFHGIPQQCVDAGDPYGAHCEETAKQLANALQLTPDQWVASYQSRFGPKKWLQPYTDQVLENWAKEGVSSVTVISPAFAADCLETLEELAIGSREIFIENGGKTFNLVPCLNDRKDHIELFKNLILEKLPVQKG